MAGARFSSSNVMSVDAPAGGAGWGVSAGRATGGFQSQSQADEVQKREPGSGFLRPQRCADVAGNWIPSRGALSHGPIIGVCAQNFLRCFSASQPGQTMAQYVYSMNRVSKTVPPKRQILKDISLSFFPGAKIGVLGLNGTGKSTLLRIMAGRDTEYRGEAQLAPGATVGLLEQEPGLDSSKDVRGNVEDGVRGLRDLLDRFNELSMNYSEETADEFARLQDQIDAAGAWELDQMLDQAMDA